MGGFLATAEEKTAEDATYAYFCFKEVLTLS